MGGRSLVYVCQGAEMFVKDLSRYIYIGEDA